MRVPKRVAMSGDLMVDSSVVTMAASRVADWADYSVGTKAVQRVAVKADQTAVRMEAQ